MQTPSSHSLAAVLAATLLVACHEPLPVESKLFSCERDTQCLVGWVCRPIPESPTLKGCYKEGEAPDAVVEPAPDVADPGLDTADPGVDPGGELDEGLGPDAPELPPECEGDGQCQDKITEPQCQTASCVDGACVVEDLESACDDGDPCTDNDGCQGGACVGDAYTCPGSELLCVVNECVGGGQCEESVVEGFCLLGGACAQDGLPAGDCQVCDAANNQAVAAEDGAACGGVGCYAPGTCEGGACQAQWLCEGDCCSAKSGPGCDDPAIALCVCQANAACCTSVWAESCVVEATESCGLICR